MSRKLYLTFRFMKSEHSWGSTMYNLVSCYDSLEMRARGELLSDKVTENTNLQTHKYWQARKLLIIFFHFFSLDMVLLLCNKICKCIFICHLNQTRTHLMQFEKQKKNTMSTKHAKSFHVK